jgi:hypothetical protein
VGHASRLFLAITFALCVGFVCSPRMHVCGLAKLLPGF